MTHLKVGLSVSIFLCLLGCPISAASPVYSYFVGVWSRCSVTCGSGGVQHRIVLCYEISPIYQRVDDSHCHSRGLPRQQRSRICTAVACPTTTTPSYEYRVGQWEKCSVTCGQGTQIRNVTCHETSPSERMVSNLDCQAARLEQPNRSRTCREAVCPVYGYFIGSWSPCSVTCGNGVQNRDVSCYEFSPRSRRVSDSFCEALGYLRARASQRCMMNVCPVYEYRVGSWGRCSGMCGNGTRNRSVACSEVIPLERTVSNAYCQSAGLEQPDASQRCRIDCAVYEYAPGPWEPCPVQCGNGTQRRPLTCLETSPLQREVDIAQCQSVGAEQPDAIRDCRAECEYRYVMWDYCSQCERNEQNESVECWQTSPSSRKLDSNLCANFGANRAAVRKMDRCHSQCLERERLSSGASSSLPLRSSDLTYVVGENASVIVTYELHLKCSIAANPPVTSYKWNATFDVYNVDYLHPGHRWGAIRISEGMGDTLTLRTERLLYSGIYNCIADNGVNMAIRSSAVRVYGMQRCVRPNVMRVSSTEAGLTFDCPTSTDTMFPCEISSYVVEYRNAKNEMTQRGTSQVPAYMLKDLAPNAVYTVRVMAIYNRPVCQKGVRFSDWSTFRALAADE